MWPFMGYQHMTQALSGFKCTGRWCMCMAALFLGFSTRVVFGGLGAAECVGFRTLRAARQ